MKKTIVLSAVLLLLALAACGGKKSKVKTKTSEQNFVVEGVIENGRGAVVQLGKVTGDDLLIIGSDTADVNGKFKIEGFEREKFIAVLSFEVTKRIFLIVDSNSNINLNIPAVNYETYAVDGSADSKILREIRQIEKTFELRMTDLRKAFEALPSGDEKGQNKIREQYETLLAESNAVYSKEVMETNNPMIQLFGYYILQQNFNDSVMGVIIKNIEANNLSNEITKHFSNKYKSIMATAIGSKAPEIILPDSSGQPFALSSLRGKVVLVDFWASWCGPCREENPNVLNAYNQFKDKGFEILGISLDEKRSSWIEAIYADKIHWIHLSELRGWESSAARSYGVSGIPAAFLLDREGNIIAKDLRGAALIEKLKEVLN